MTADNLQNTRMSCGVSRDMRFSNRLTQQKKKDKPSTPSQDDVCDYYRTFGGAARKCIQPCAWPNTKNQSATLASATDHAKGLLFLCDKISGRQFQVDTGSEISVLPAARLDKCAGLSGPVLLATNGSSIKTYGTHPLCLQNILAEEHAVSLKLPTIWPSQPGARHIIQSRPLW